MLEFGRRQVRLVALNLNEAVILALRVASLGKVYGPEIEVYDLEDANRALIELKRGPVRGAKVLRVKR